MNNELKSLIDLVSQVPFPHSLAFNMSKTAKHWLLDYNYFFIRQDYTLKDLPFRSTWLGAHGNFQAMIHAEVKYSVERYWSDKLNVGAVEVFAWSMETVEQDTGLVLPYDRAGNNKGIYCHCLNRVEELIGQEYGLAYIDAKKKQKLADLNNIELLLK